MFDEELVDRVGIDTGLDRQHLRRSRRGGDTEHRSAVDLEVADGGFERGGLAGPGGADDQHQPATAGDGCGGFGLRAGQRPAGVFDGGPLIGAAGGGALFGPVDQGVFLVEDRLGGERTIHR